MVIKCDKFRRTKLKYMGGYILLLLAMFFIISRFTKKNSKPVKPQKKEISEYELWRGCLNDASSLTSKARFSPQGREMLPSLSEDIHVIIPLPFISLSPGGYNNIRSKLTRLLIHCSSAVRIHVVTDEASYEMVDSIFSEVNFTTSCPFTHHKVEITDFTTEMQEIIQNFGVSSDLVDTVMSFIPLLLPYYFRNIKRVIYHNIHVIYRGDVLNLNDLFFGFDDKTTVGAVYNVVYVSEGVLSLSSSDSSIKLWDTNLFLLDLEKMRKFGTIKHELGKDNLSEAIELFGRKITLSNWMLYLSEKYPEALTDIKCKDSKYNDRHVAEYQFVCDRFGNPVAKWDKVSLNL